MSVSLKLELYMKELVIGQIVFINPALKEDDSRFGIDNDMLDNPAMPLEIIDFDPSDDSVLLSFGKDDDIWWLGIEEILTELPA